MKNDKALREHLEKQGEEGKEALKLLNEAIAEADGNESELTSIRLENGTLKKSVVDITKERDDLKNESNNPPPPNTDSELAKTVKEQAEELQKLKAEREEEKKQQLEADEIKRKDTINTYHKKIFSGMFGDFVGDTLLKNMVSDGTIYLDADGSHKYKAKNGAVYSNDEIGERIRIDFKEQITGKKGSDSESNRHTKNEGAEDYENRSSKSLITEGLGNILG